MKKILLMTAVAMMSIGIANAQTAKLPNGKSVPVRLTSDIYSNSKTQTEPTAIVDSDVRDDSNGHVLIRRGTPVVLDAHIQKARGVGKPASVKLLCLTTTAVDGQTIRLQGGYDKEGQSRKGTALGVGLGVGIPVCWPCLFCLCIKGEKLHIPQNTMFSNVVVNDTYRIATEHAE